MAKLKCPVTFGSSISVSDTIGIGVSINRAHIDAEKCEQLFTGRRLQVEIGDAKSIQTK